MTATLVKKNQDNRSRATESLQTPAYLYDVMCSDGWVSCWSGDRNDFPSCCPPPIATSSSAPIRVVMPVDETKFPPPPVQEQCSYEPCCLMGNPKCLMAVRDDANWCRETSSELAKRCPGIVVDPKSPPTGSPLPPCGGSNNTRCTQPGYECLVDMVSYRPVSVGEPGVCVFRSPTSTSTPTLPVNCYYQQVQCKMAPCPPILICPIPSITPNLEPTIYPQPTSFPKITTIPKPTIYPTPTEISTQILEPPPHQVSVFDNFQRFLSDPVQFLRGLFKFAD